MIWTSREWRRTGSPDRHQTGSQETGENPAEIPRLKWIQPLKNDLEQICLPSEEVEKI